MKNVEDRMEFNSILILNRPATFESFAWNTEGDTHHGKWVRTGGDWKMTGKKREFQPGIYGAAFIQMAAAWNAIPYVVVLSEETMWEMYQGDLEELDLGVIFKPTDFDLSFKDIWFDRSDIEKLEAVGIKNLHDLLVLTQEALEAKVGAEHAKRVKSKVGQWAWFTHFPPGTQDKIAWDIFKQKKPSHI